VGASYEKARVDLERRPAIEAEHTPPAQTLLLTKRINITVN
jgi:hypothetical protein